MSSERPAIAAEGLSKRYEIYAKPRDRLKQLALAPLIASTGRAAPRYFRELWALRDVSFEVRRGETLGIIGRNGAGKSTLLQIIAGTLAPTAGRLDVVGRVAALLELGSGFNPDFTGRENVMLNGRILGLSRQEIEARFDRIAAFADIGEFIDQAVKTYSSGMYLRLAFAVQAHLDASIIIIDEALAVGDVFFRQKCYARLRQLREDGAAILLVSHSMPEIEQYCERAIVLDRGTVHYQGPGPEAAKHYYLLHQGPRRQSEAAVAATPRAPAGADAGHPPAQAWLDLSRVSQVGDGRARCTGVALCGAGGEARSSFRQGETAVFHYEFELAEALEVPICGITLADERGIIVFGKNSWQYDAAVPTGLRAGERVYCRQEVRLDLAPGDYTFEVGMATVLLEEWERRARTPFQETVSSHHRVCHIARAGSFSIGLALVDGVPVLTHHGIANLPGRMAVRCVVPETAGAPHA